MTDRKKPYEAHVYNLTIAPMRQPLENPVTVESQKAWHEDARNRVKRLIRSLCCEERVFCEVTHVKRTNRRNEQKYMLTGDKHQYSFEEVVAKVMELINGKNS